jgi:hypothetical protein
VRSSRVLPRRQQAALLRGARRLLEVAKLAHEYGFYTLFHYLLFYLQRVRFSDEVQAVQYFHYVVTSWGLFNVGRETLANEHSRAALHSFKENVRTVVVSNPLLFLCPEPEGPFELFSLKPYICLDFMRRLMEAPVAGCHERTVVAFLIDWMTHHYSPANTDPGEIVDVQPPEEAIALFDLVRWHQFDAPSLMDLYNLVMLNRQKTISASSPSSSASPPQPLLPLPPPPPPKKKRKKEKKTPEPTPAKAGPAVVSSPPLYRVSEKMRQMLTEIITEVLFIKMAPASSLPLSLPLPGGEGGGRRNNSPTPMEDSHSIPEYDSDLPSTVGPKHYTVMVDPLVHPSIGGGVATVPGNMFPGSAFARPKRKRPEITAENASDSDVAATSTHRRDTEVKHLKSWHSGIHAAKQREARAPPDPSHVFKLENLKRLLFAEESSSVTQSSSRGGESSHSSLEE